MSRSGAHDFDASLLDEKGVELGHLSFVGGSFHVVWKGRGYDYRTLQFPDGRVGVLDDAANDALIVTCFAGLDILTGLGVESPEALTPLRAIGVAQAAGPGVGSAEPVTPVRGVVDDSEQASSGRALTPDDGVSYGGYFAGSYLGSLAIYCVYSVNDPNIYELSGTAYVQGSAQVTCNNVVSLISITVELWGSVNQGATWYGYAGPVTLSKPSTSSFVLSTAAFVGCVNVYAQTGASFVIVPPPAYIPPAYASPNVFSSPVQLDCTPPSPTIAYTTDATHSSCGFDAADPGDVIALWGSNFGVAGGPPPSVTTLDGTELFPPNGWWSPTEIVVQLPASQPGPLWLQVTSPSAPTGGWIDVTVDDGVCGGAGGGGEGGGGGGGADCGGSYCDICTTEGQAEGCYGLNDEPGVWCDDTNSCLPMGQTCCVMDGD